jgi:hypothetical protein
MQNKLIKPVLFASKRINICFIFAYICFEGGGVRRGETEGYVEGAESEGENKRGQLMKLKSMKIYCIEKSIN